ncbi:MAG: pyridoxal phosphate-dependent aminotransferase [Eubacterium sp.]|nr:pyridoxal phosphate-dependent aminotransferase [Eubacterium sp.]MCM1304660.1 pyridoxal phosphate-dependent aminotransferase [Butyrivibrio sp.]MCM1344472.1 pyridoxal phosphate-dependent aminotransferase [Muribaculaceae bacterium]MCM1411861.1 pyridoxal phosphate-dependent aminotransferase [Lachnospiraceae bacterium]
MKYDFDQEIDRRGKNCLKYDFAAERGKPEGLLPMWVADMDLPAAEEIKQALHQAAEHGIYGYSEVKEPYFQAVHDWMLRYHGWGVERDWMVKTPGIVYAIAAAVRAFTKEGDGVMIQNPGYYPFGQVVRDNGRVLADNTLREENGRYTMDFEDMERQMESSHVKLFLLCSPHNPVGRVWTEEELRRLGEICLKYRVLIVSDEIHHDFVFPGYRHHVLAGLDERFREITITCTAPSKTFNIAGLQVSNIFIPDGELREAFVKEIGRTGYSQLNQMGLVACEAAYRYGRDWLDQLLVYLKGNLDLARDFIDREMPGVKLVEPEGTFLLWLDCRGLQISDDELDQLVIEKAKLWLDGGRMFGPCGSGYQRVNMACPRATLERALRQFADALKYYA